MKVAIITDTHFGFEKNSELVLKNTLKFFKEQFVPQLIKNKIYHIFILGDLFDNRTSISTKVHNEVYELFNDILKDFNIYIILGNHDIYYNSSINVHSLKFLNKFQNIHVIDKPELIKLNNMNILMIPWLIDQENIIDIFKQFKTDNIIANVLMGHFDIAGFNFNKKVLSKNGLPINCFFNLFNLVFSGHFHTRSVKKSGNTEIVYVGSPYQMNRGCADEERGYIILNLDIKSLTYEFISNEISPQFVTVNYPNKITEEIIKNNRVDIYIKYDKDNYAPEDFNKYIEEVDEMQPATREIFYIANNETMTDFDISNCNFSSMPELFKKYLDANKIPTIEREYLYNKFTKIYEKVRGE